MSKKPDKPMFFNYKVKCFMYYHYIKKLPAFEAYQKSGYVCSNNTLASKSAWDLKSRLESHEGFDEIVRQLYPIPELVSDMILIKSEAKDPNLRFKTVAQLGKWAGLERDKDGAALAGFSLTIMAGKAAIQVNAGDQQPDEPDSPERAQRIKDGKPQSFIK